MNKQRSGPQRGPWAVLLLCLCAAAAAAAGAWAEPSVTTDKLDYYPGEVVQITGAGFHPNEPILLQIVALDELPWTDGGPGAYEWAWFGTDANGSFAATWVVPEAALGREFLLTADCDHGLHAQTTFTDGNVRVRSASPDYTFSLEWTVYTGSTVCAGTPSSQGFEAEVDHTPAGEFAVTGLSTTSSITLVASAANSLGGAFERWTSDDGLFESDSRSVCISAAFTGNRIFRAHYAAPPAPTTLSVANANVECGGTASLSATLTSEGAAVAGKSIAFTLLGASVGSASTDSSGVATLTGVSVSTTVLGTVPGAIGASFAGDAAYSPASGSAGLTVVDTTPPTITLNGAAAVTVECHDTFSDPGATATDSCAGDLTEEIQVLGSVDTETPGTYEITYNVSDPAGNAAETVTRTVTVVDTTAPVVACKQGVSVSLDSGGAASLTSADLVEDYSDACSDEVTLQVSRTNADESFDESVTFGCDDVGEQTVYLKATDESGNSSTCQVAVTVRDTTAPTVTITAPVSGTLYGIDEVPVLNGTASDNCCVATAQWSVVSLAAAAEVAQPSQGDCPIESLEASCTFTKPGIYAITLEVRDASGNSQTADTVSGLPAYIVVYDPSAGFVTGGGWINSPAGAYRDDPSLVGKANFGFVSKYQKGAKVPTGETEFQFKAGDLNFKSTSYQWMVVSGTSKAQYKGWGTINGTGNYGFLLSVVDGGAKGTDRFRIKIWDVDDHDRIVYDNQELSKAYNDETNDAADINSGGSTALGGGSIVIHAK